ncbi:hypothetical protein B5X24_HaOG205888 [Helicoverpa armigera]|uniref:PLD phosphodiesterase domain-containing protein n=1 Tax=Helicoverpa armigera TaxID=29058 RepID=A0A2W1BQ04_HELAM|nr:hypothetical protein B5X24_HaOG205888 [Helicoverpa armigera]
MPSWWDYLHFNRQYNNKRNLEEGLFQIASQTCNILVKVNNTNNINLTRNNRSDEYGCAGPPKNKSSMQICVPKFRKNSITSGCNPGLSTVLESGSVGNASSSDEELEQWEQIFMMRDENGNSYNDKLSLVESIPEGHMYPPNVTHLPTKNVWLDLIDEAQTRIEIASFYWTLRYNEEYPYNSSIEGEQVFQALYAAGSKRNIDLKIAQNWPSKNFPNVDTEYLVKKKAAQVKELGIVAFNCSCLAEDLGKVFDVYWSLGTPDAVVPDSWPSELNTDINMEHPVNISDAQHNYGAYITSSPPPLSPQGRTDDSNAIVSIIESAEEFVYISVMEYEPMCTFTHKMSFWPKIDDAIRKAALENKVKVKLLISWWKHSAPSEDYFLRSLTDLSQAYPRVDLQVKRFVVPSTPEQDKIPFGRVNHNKYMVTDRTAYIGTSNWSGDYFISTAGVAFVFQDQTHDGSFQNLTRDIRKDLQEVFERDWNSPYAVPLRRL